MNLELSDMPEIVMPIPENRLAALFGQMHDALRVELVEMDAEIHGACLAVVTASNLLLKGEPGTGKSHLGNRFFARIANMKYFHTLMDSYTVPDKILGPYDLPTLRETGAYIRRIKGYLPDAHVANLEEVFNTSEPLLKSMHMIAYEHVFDQDGVLIPVPLKILFGSTNDLPKAGTARAFFDRILQIFDVSPPMEKANIIHMMQFVPNPNPEPIMTWDDVLAAQEEVRQVRISDDVYSVLADIWRELDGENLAPSPRRQVQCCNLLRGEAWLDGADEVSTDHFSALVPALWKSPDQIDVIAGIVLSHANPLENETMQLLRDIAELAASVQRTVDTKDGDRLGMGRDCYAKTSRAYEDYGKLHARASGSRRQLGLLQQARDRVNTQAARLLKEIFELEEGSVQFPGATPTP